MGGSDQFLKRGPAYDLADLKKLLPNYTPRPNVIERAREFVNAATHLEAIPIMRKLVASLEAADFLRGHERLYGKRGAVRLDEYVKVNEHGLWYVKFDIQESGRLVLHSCHESDEEECVLYNGTKLRKPSGS